MLKRVTDNIIVEAISTSKTYGIFTLSPEGIVLSWSPGCFIIQGYSGEEVIGTEFSELYEKEICKQPGYFKALLEKAVQFGQSEEEGWRQRKNGTMFWSTLIITPVYNVDKRLVSFCAISRDLTEKKLPAEIPEITVAACRGEVLATSNFTWYRNFDGKFTTPHLQWEQFTGQQWPEYLEFGWLAMHPPEEREKIKKFWHELTKFDFSSVKGNWEVLEDPMIAEKLIIKTKLWSKLHNEYRYIVTSVVPCFREYDTIQAWAGNEKDIHKATLLELKLHQTLEKQQLMISSARIGMWQIDLEANYISIDETIAYLININLDTFNHTFDEILLCIHPDDRIKLTQSVENCTRTGEIDDIHIRALWKNNSIHHLAGRGKTQRNDHNEPVILLNTFWDITEAQNLLENTLKNQMLKKQMHEQFEFIDTICHELRNPLNGITGILDELHELATTFSNIREEEQLFNFGIEKFSKSYQLLHESIGVIEDCALHQRDVIDKMIEITKIESKKLNVIKKSFSLQEVIKSVIQIHSIIISRPLITHQSLI